MDKKYSTLVFLLTLCLVTLYACNKQKEVMKPDQEKVEDDYYVAAYVWPSCHNGTRNSEVLWPEGIGEWEIIQKGTPRFEGHYQPKVPFWGYEMDDNPKVMEKWIDKARDHGVNVFIFDWYWFDGKPFLESSINNGFLKAKNNESINFYIMWANHDVKKNYWNHYKYNSDSLLWDGATDFENFKLIVDRVIKQYFNKPNYFKIDNMPVFSIFSIYNLIEGFGSLEDTKKALDYFREKTVKAGYPGLHIQLIGLGQPSPSLVDNINFLEINSVTKYNWGGPHREDYIRWGVEAIERRNAWDSALTIPYFANASIGWDDTPRFPNKTKKDVVHLNTSPTSFSTFLHQAKEYADSKPNQPKLITVFSWNEWIEGSYLLPDMKYGFQYLETVKEVMNGKYDE